MIIDLHVHTYPKSACSGLRPEELFKRTRELGIDAVCLTEHDLVWPKEQVDELVAQYGVPVFRGVEVTTSGGHVLVFGLESVEGTYWNIRKLRTLVDSVGGVMILAHPMRSGFSLRRRSLSGVPEEDIPKLFDAIEVLNGTEIENYNGHALQISENVGLNGTGGSDAHSAAELGTCVTVFDGEIRSDKELIEAIKSNGYRARRLR